MADAEQTSDSPAAAYRVLARKYRPQSFADLIGQDALVRTLTNAIDSDRIAQAYILTGVRGVGKTTTARILARALNYRGPEGDRGPTAGPTDDCPICRAIAEDRHVDVIEMDAASRTGVGDIRELIEGVRYRPVEARYKVYIIDEVHMLSSNAFNALLKTLEEPPPHVVFIFATTEIRKVPVTVLSRCQRFDLRRVSPALLSAHFTRIAEAEGVTAAPEAIQLIARAADGSVRDGLSLLDQAIALTGAKLEAVAVADMLGIADRGRLFDLLEATLADRLSEALDILGDLYARGGDPILVLQDLMEIVHAATRLKLTPASAEEAALPDLERNRGQALGDGLGLAELARAWQLLLKGHGEAQLAPLPLQAVEMVLIRLAHASSLPPPGEVIRQLRGEAAKSPGQAANTKLQERPAAAPASAPPPAAPASTAPVSSDASGSGPVASGTAVTELRTTERRQPEPQPEPRPEAEAILAPPRGELAVTSFQALVELARTKGEHVLANHLDCDVALVSFASGRLVLRPLAEAPKDLVVRLGRLLGEWTGQDWRVETSRDEGEAPLRQQAKAAAAEHQALALQHPLAKAFLEAFPDAKLIAHRREASVGLAPAEEDEEGFDGPSLEERALLAGLSPDELDDDDER
ncbi:MAG: DNA polymerase III subunit gamma/tau [Rhodospirillales bacterium]